MTPVSLNLKQGGENGHSFVETKPSVHVEVADGHLVDVLACGEVINIMVIDGGPFIVQLRNALYVPGLIHRLFHVYSLFSSDWNSFENHSTQKVKIDQCIIS
jgi:hypothetical protein